MKWPLQDRLAQSYAYHYYLKAARKHVKKTSSSSSSLSPLPSRPPPPPSPPPSVPSREVGGVVAYPQQDLSSWIMTQDQPYITFQYQQPIRPLHKQQKQQRKSKRGKAKKHTQGVYKNHNYNTTSNHEQEDEEEGEQEALWQFQLIQLELRFQKDNSSSGGGGTTTTTAAGGTNTGTTTSPHGWTIQGHGTCRNHSPGASDTSTSKMVNLQICEGHLAPNGEFYWIEERRYPSKSSSNSSSASNAFVKMKQLVTGTLTCHPWDTTVWQVVDGLAMTQQWGRSRPTDGDWRETLLHFQSKAGETTISGKTSDTNISSPTHQQDASPTVDHTLALDKALITNDIMTTTLTNQAVMNDKSQVEHTSSLPESSTNPKEEDTSLLSNKEATTDGYTARRDGEITTNDEEHQQQKQQQGGFVTLLSLTKEDPTLVDTTSADTSKKELSILQGTNTVEETSTLTTESILNNENPDENNTDQVKNRADQVDSLLVEEKADIKTDSTNVDLNNTIRHTNVLQRRNETDTPALAVVPSDSLLPTIREFRHVVMAALEQARKATNKNGAVGVDTDNNDTDGTAVLEDDDELIRQAYEDVMFSIDESIFQEEEEEVGDEDEDYVLTTTDVDDPLFAETEEDHEIVKLHALRQKTLETKSLLERLHSIDENSLTDNENAVEWTPEAVESAHPQPMNISASALGSPTSVQYHHDSPVGAKDSDSLQEYHVVEQEKARLHDEVQRLTDTFESLFQSFRH